MDTARVFWSGRSQAVRLPKDYRFDDDVVRIRKHGAAVVLEPIATDWSWLDAIDDVLGADVPRAVKAQPAPQERRELDDLFK